MYRKETLESNPSRIMMVPVLTVAGFIKFKGLLCFVYGLLDKPIVVL